eukprot:4652907-Amphidinium_carterae.1
MLSSLNGVGLGKNTDHGANVVDIQTVLNRIRLNLSAHNRVLRLPQRSATRPSKGPPYEPK